MASRRGMITSTPQLALTGWVRYRGRLSWRLPVLYRGIKVQLRTGLRRRRSDLRAADKSQFDVEGNKAAIMVGVSKGTVVYVAAFVLLLFWAFFVQADTRRVDGHSMLPTLEGGDLVVIQNVPIGEVHVGDIVVYGSPCSAYGESVVHRVVNITGAGLITKGDNNQYTDQYPQAQIAVSPITQQCLEGKVVFVIPYVEFLANYVNANGLPQWLNYVPSILVLFVVIALVLKDNEGEKRST